MNRIKAYRTLLYSGDLLAVDLGSFAVKVLSLKAKERSLTVLGSAQREVWRELAEAKSDEEKADIYARALQELLAGRGFMPRNASIALSGNTVIVRFLGLAEGAKFDADEDLPAEARALVPFEASDAIIFTSILDGSKGNHKARTELMLTIAQKKTVHGGMSVARRAGLRPAVIINDFLALANAYEFFEGRKAETVVLVNMGATSTSVSVVENGAPSAARVFNIAGNTFTRAVKREFDVDLDEAERLKISVGLTVPEGKTAEEDLIAGRVARALLPAVKDLSGEIQRTIDVFLERRPAEYPPIVRIVLAGGSAELKGLPERLASDTGMSVDVFRPMVNVTSIDDSLGIAPLAPGFAAACGLGLSNTLVRRTHKPRINLVPRRARRSAIIGDISPNFWRLIAGPVLVVSALSIYGVWAVRVSRREAATEQRLEATAKKERALQGKFLKKKAAAIKVPVDPFAFLARLTVSGVFGDSQNSLVMLNGGGASFVARGGKLFQENEKEVPGVTSEIRDNSLSLSAGGRRYSIALPK